MCCKCKKEEKNGFSTRIKIEELKVEINMLISGISVMRMRILYVWICKRQ